MTLPARPLHQSNGMLGAARAEDGELGLGWTLPNEGGSGPVQAITMTDLTEDGVKDVVVGRGDGRMQVYGFDVSEVPDKQVCACPHLAPQAAAARSPRLHGTAPQFEYDLGESVRSVDTGRLAAPDYKEVLCCTYSGA